MIGKEKYNKIKDIVIVIALCIILVVSVVVLYKALESGNNSMLSNQTNSYTISINDKYSNLSGKVEFITINSSEHDYNIEYVTDEILKQLNSLYSPKYYGNTINNIKIVEVLKNRFEITFNSSADDMIYISSAELRSYYGSYYFTGIKNPVPA